MHVSDSCRQFCAERRRGIRGHRYEHGFDLQPRPERLELPVNREKPRHVLVASTSEFVHAAVPDGHVCEMSAVMECAPQHIFHVLTKRERRLAAPAPVLTRRSQVWMGATVGRLACRGRADVLRKVPAAFRRIPTDPRPGQLDDLDLDGVHLVVAGGESGPEHRPPRIELLRDLSDRCVATGACFTSEGWGGGTQRAGGRVLDGRDWKESPAQRCVAWAPAPDRCRPGCSDRRRPRRRHRGAGC